MADNTSSRFRYINLYNYLVAVLWIQEEAKLMIDVQELMLEYGKLISLIMNVKRDNTPEYIDYLLKEVNKHIEFFNRVNKEM